MAESDGLKLAKGMDLSYNVRVQVLWGECLAQHKKRDLL